jgi:hypothetical protein
VLEDAVDDLWLGDERDDVHGLAAAGARERIDLDLARRVESIVSL